ncbi:hypothetical protein [Lysinibacillus piscis]|uniref:Uncharacterized protein n=1 Tax=Lysinibacillus piscis TaxID=2518931 RepID=A0ABQ5NJW5_9BACI|nr:hypothetical protein [Lysinibacillus sp. KH24]GLC88661.1 hypothetical protein LYSBPC_17880 [Lysinibacillus sp. KH24]
MEVYINHRNEKLKTTNPKLYEKIKKMERKVGDAIFSPTKKCIDGKKHDFIVIAYEKKCFYVGCVKCEEVAIIKQYTPPKEK